MDGKLCPGIYHPRLEIFTPPPSFRERPPFNSEIFQLPPSRFPNWGRLVGGQFGQNGQKLHENYKIGIFESKQWGGGGGDKPIFWVVGEISPAPPY